MAPLPCMHVLYNVGSRRKYTTGGQDHTVSLPRYLRVITASRNSEELHAADCPHQSLESLFTENEGARFARVDYSNALKKVHAPPPHP